MNAIALNLVVIYASEIENSRRLYTTIGIALKREKHGRGPEHYAGEIGGVVLEIYPTADSRPGNDVRLGFEVISVSETIRALTELGAEVVFAPHEFHWGIRAVVKDPDGRRIELRQAAT